MKTPQFLNIDDSQPGVIRDVWNHNSDPLKAHMAIVKTSLLVHRYPLKAIPAMLARKRWIAASYVMVTKK